VKYAPGVRIPPWSPRRACSRSPHRRPASPWSRGQADGRDPSSPRLLDVRPVEGWLARSWDARNLERTVPHTAACEPLGPLEASCTLEVHYEDRALFPGVRTVTIDVSCRRPRARVSDCDWSSFDGRQLAGRPVAHAVGCA
jgi:hypothetical protein